MTLSQPDPKSIKMRIIKELDKKLHWQPHNLPPKRPDLPRSRRTLTVGVPPYPPSAAGSPGSEALLPRLLVPLVRHRHLLH
ncbi:hypothetical protein BN873_610114 [Candidatus Competibacter denitrificans Run_A_D11]|uniref:Uncharacterized protein n=1 Tax=Candidatus Competibacter denitrificans Run_A_D11 TaxID=1400863 RepID=W6M7V0_9GAMM|nr:hypothetical protein BN873_610114 [Candidatus Competibacter denitrificans Run_A_D11]